jgi:hypothetical protein
VLSDAKAAPPPQASTPPSCITPFSTTANIHLHPPLLPSPLKEGPTRESDRIHTRISHQSLKPRRLLLIILTSYPNPFKFSSQSLSAITGYIIRTGRSAARLPHTSPAITVCGCACDHHTQLPLHLPSRPQLRCLLVVVRAFSIKSPTLALHQFHPSTATAEPHPFAIHRSASSQSMYTWIPRSSADEPGLFHVAALISAACHSGDHSGPSRSSMTSAGPAKHVALVSSTTLHSLCVIASVATTGYLELHAPHDLRHLLTFVGSAAMLGVTSWMEPPYS